ncbi:MAG: protein tyrosine phosphatase, partial [Actinomycetes bacterium]
MSLFTVLATSKVAAGVLAASTIAVGGTGAAAVSGVLPAEAQQTAHDLFGAPAPQLAAEAAAEGQAT